jgi:ribonuclease P protein component
MPYAYRKSERLRKNSEFVSVMKKGKRLSVDGLSLFYAENGAEDFRVGISVSKKLANAVVRNRLRRQVRACVSLALRGHALGYDLVFMARQGLVGAAYGGILKAVQTALARSVLRSVKPEGARP